MGWEQLRTLLVKLVAKQKKMVEFLKNVVKNDLLIQQKYSIELIAWHSNNIINILFKIVYR